MEPLVQFGKYGTADLIAWTIASETAYTWTARKWRPRIALSANIVSGDRDPLDPDLQTFNPLYPRGNYFSEDSTLGPQNFYNALLFLTVHPAEGMAQTVDYNLYWRMSERDAVYGIGGSILGSAQSSNPHSDAHFVATGLSFSVEWALNRNFGFTGIYTINKAQAFLKETVPAETVGFLELTARFRF